MTLEEEREIQKVDSPKTHYQITKSNVLIDSVYSLSSNEQKLLLMVISLLSPDTEEFKTYRLSVSSIKEIIGTTSGDFYSQLKTMTYNILSKPFWYQDKETGREIQGSWFSTSEYLDNQGMVEFEFSPKVKHLLLNLKSNFTSYTLGFVVKLKSKYSIRIYELLKKNERLNKLYISVEDLRKLLSVDSHYQKYSQFKINVLKVAQREINQNTDIHFTITEFKKGRKVDKLRFNITDNKKYKPKDKSIDLFNLNETGYRLINYQVSQSKVEELLQRYDDKYLNDRMNQLDFELKDNEKKVLSIGIGRYLYNLIINTDWINDKYQRYIEEEQRKEEELVKQEEKRVIKKRKQEYEDYIDSHICEYDELNEIQKERVSSIFEQQRSIIFKGDLFKEDTRRHIEEQIKKDIIREVIKENLQTFEEWIRE